MSPRLSVNMQIEPAPQFSIPNASEVMGYCTNCDTGFVKQGLECPRCSSTAWSELRVILRAAEQVARNDRPVF